MISASTLLHTVENGAFGSTESTLRAAARCFALFLGMPMMFEKGWRASCAAVPTERNSGEYMIVSRGNFFCKRSVLPGMTVDLSTTTLPSPTQDSTLSTLEMSKPFGVVGVHTATNTISQSLIFSLLLMYLGSSE